MKMKLTLYILLFSIGFTAKAQTYSWAKKIGGNDIDQINAMTTDTAGNVFVAGSFRGSMDADPGPAIDVHSSSGNNNSDIFFGKYDASGNYLWAKSLSGDPNAYNNEEATAIAVDASGNVYIAGTFTSFVDFDPGAGTTTITQAYAPSSQNFFLAKYDAAGNFIWAKNFGVKSFVGDKVALYVDAIGNAYLSGYFATPADFDPNAGTSILTPIGYQDIYLVKFSTSGNLIWAKNIGGPTTSAKTLGINGTTNGNIRIVGYFASFVDFDPSVANHTLDGGIGNSFFAEYDNSGNYVFAKSLEGQRSEIDDLESDSSGNFYVAGLLWGTTDFDSGIGVDDLSSLAAGIADNFFAKYDASGNYVFAKIIHGGYYNNDKPNLTLDSNRNIYVTGEYTGSGDFDPGVGIFNLTTLSSASINLFFGKYSPTGDLQWVKGIGEINGEKTSGIKVNKYNEVIIAGVFNNTCDFNPGPVVSNLISSGNGDGFIAKYSDASTAINQNNNLTNSTSIYPNPATALIYLQSEEKIKGIRCISSTGQTIELNFTENAISIEAIPRGLYVLSIETTKGNSFIRRFIKE